MKKLVFKMKKVAFAVSLLCVSASVFGMGHMSVNDISWFASAENGNLKVINMQIRSGQDLNRKNGGGNTALMIAARRGHFDIVNSLMGSDINAINKKGETALILATRAGHHGIVKLLIDSGADVNVESWGSGHFQIGMERLQKSKRLAQRVRKLGLSASIIKGRSPLVIATELGDTEVVGG